MKLALALLLLASTQDPKLEDPANKAKDAKKKAAPRVPPKVGPKEVDDAIAQGVEALKGSGSPGSHRDIRNSDELILLTFIHAGLPEKDRTFQEYLRKALTCKLERTYNVSLLAMCLEELDRVKYQERIAHCAQFLVDNQCPNGQWSYGNPVESVPEVTSPTTAGGNPGADVATTSLSVPKRGDPEWKDRKPKPKVLRQIEIRKTRDGPGDGDNSNAQYAALGLRACFDAGIRFPAQTVARAADWWRKSQHKEDRSKPGAGEAKDVATGPGAVNFNAPPRGWCYHGYNHCKSPDVAYSSMTAGAVCALVIYDYMTGQNWKSDGNVRSGLAWLTNHFTVTGNYGPPEVGTHSEKTHYYYYLYALERVGLLYGTEKLGVYEWYPEGARVILDAQGGGWSTSDNSTTTWDTCFAILFLRRATRPLQDVASKAAGSPEK